MPRLGRQEGQAPEVQIVALGPEEDASGRYVPRAVFDVGGTPPYALVSS